MLDEGISRLIARIYDGAHDDRMWDAAIAQLLDLTEGRCVFVSCVDLRCGAFDYARFHGAGDARFLDAVTEYQTERFRDDPTLRYAVRYPDRRKVSLRQVLNADPQNAADIAFARWVKSEMRTVDTHIHYTPPDDKLILGVSLHAKATDGALTQDAKQLLALVFPHIDNARRLIARAPDLSSETEARLIVDQTGRIRSASPAALALLATADGLTIRDNRLCGARRSEDQRIVALVRSAVRATSDGTAGGTIGVPRPSGKRPWMVRATALPGGSGPFTAFGPASLLTIIDREAGPGPTAAGRWRALFGFTPSETRLVETLLSGEDNLRAAADRLGIAYATARVHLASVFYKAGVNSQSQLARLLTRLGVWAMALWSALDQATVLLA